MAKNPRLIDLTGKRFGRWSVLNQNGNDFRGGALWACACDCGTTKTVIGADLRNGKSLSCGCIDEVRPRLTKHDGKGTRLYTIWKNMRGRCHNSKNPGWVNYGGRGISICREWDDFIEFKKWAISAGYRSDLSIERRDVNGNYCPENCTWAGADIQSANRRIVRKAPDGELWLHKAKANGISNAAFRSRLTDGWPIEEAATHPMYKHRFERDRDEKGRWA